MFFPRALVQNKMQAAMTRIWTWVTDFISCDDKHYAKHTYL